MKRSAGRRPAGGGEVNPIGRRLFSRPSEGVLLFFGLEKTHNFFFRAVVSRGWPEKMKPFPFPQFSAVTLRITFSNEFLSLKTQKPQNFLGLRGSPRAMGRLPAGGGVG